VPETGASPPPFTEKVPTFRVRVERGRVLVEARPLPAGTRVEPALVDQAARETNGGEFYIGWQPKAPAALGRRTRLLAMSLAAGALVVSALIASSQRPLRSSRFEFGVEREFRGVALLAPYPMLRVHPPGEVARWSRYLLVSAGKHGAQSELSAFDGTSVVLRGQLIYHDDRTMIEVTPGSVSQDDSASPATRDAAGESLGLVTLRGEIVDSKCHLGVMNPGERRTHRACAKLCIRGGIPPILWVEDEAGRCQKLLLIGSDGRAVNQEVLELVGERVEITGEAVRHDDWIVLRSDPRSYRRLER